MLIPSYSGVLYEAGCDEAGRGCLAGPVFAAAVILPQNFNAEDLNDSKLLSEKKRIELKNYIEKTAISWAIGIVYPEEIDKINILNASILAMHRAIENLKIKPEYLIIDGNKFKKFKDIPFSCIVKGDRKYLSIAAASIIAKTYRDEYMLKIHKEFSQYEWNKNKGYPTTSHILAIEKYGLTKYHRKSFKICNKTLLEKMLEK